MVPIEEPIEVLLIEEAKSSANSLAIFITDQANMKIKNSLRKGSVPQWKDVISASK